MGFQRARAAEALKLTGDDMLSQGLFDGIIPEPIGGAHTNWDETFATTKSVILDTIKELSALTPTDRVAQRIDKFCKMGVVIE